MHIQVYMPHDVYYCIIRTGGKEVNHLSRKTDPCYGMRKPIQSSGEGGKEDFAYPLDVPPSSLVTKLIFIQGGRAPNKDCTPRLSFSQG